MEGLSRSPQHPGLGLSTGARISPFASSMPTHFDTGNLRQGREHFAVNCLNGFNVLNSAANIGLVCRHDEQEPFRLQSGTAFHYIRVKFEVVDPRRRIRTTVLYKGPV